jgi:DNA-binding transcriptional MerR regulator
VVKTKKAKTDLLAPPPAFTSTDVAKISGVSLRQLQWWDEKKVVSPRQEGHRRLYLAEEVLEIAVIAELRRKGFSLQKIRRVLRFLQKEVGKKLGEIHRYFQKFQAADVSGLRERPGAALECDAAAGPQAGAERNRHGGAQIKKCLKHSDLFVTLWAGRDSNILEAVWSPQAIYES